MKIKKVIINNILSIQDASITFGDSGLVLVEGYDYDTGRANGAGKTAIFNSISIGLYDKLPRKITKSEIVRRGATSAFVDITVENDGKEYRVLRERPSNVSFFIDGLKVDMTQEEFEFKIGLNYDQFLITMYNSQDSSERFIFLNDREKKDFLLKIMNLGNFNQFKKDISDELAKFKLEQEILKTKLEGYRTSISILKQQLVDPNEAQKKIDELTSDISLYNLKIKELQEIKEPDVSKYAELEKNVQSKLSNIASIRVQYQLKRNELRQLQSMTHDTECPDCSAHLNIINGKAVKAGDQSAIDAQIAVVVADINKYDSEIVKENEIKQLSEKIRAKKNEDYKDYNQAVASISQYKTAIAYKNKEIDSLNQTISKNIEVKKSMSNIIKDTQTSNNRLVQINDEINILETVSMFFDPTGAPAYIMDGVVDSFNESVTEYINHVWPNASYSLQTFKENKDKTLSTKFSEILMINGKSVSIGSLSGGELRALSLATDFAMIDVLKTKFSTDLNPIILDEPFNGLDSSGKEMIIELLEKISTDREIWITDHSSEAKAMFNRVVRVEKRNGISTIIDE